MKIVTTKDELSSAFNLWIDEFNNVNDKKKRDSEYGINQTDTLIHYINKVRAIKTGKE